MRALVLCACLLAATCTAPPPAAAPDLQLVFLGDSITEGSGLPDPALQAAPGQCAASLRRLLPGRAVTFANQGHSGHTTLDFLPGGGDCTAAIAAAQALHRQPGELVFSVMLGTNDSANHGTHGAPVDVATYERNLQALLDRLYAEFPDCRVFLHQPIWYSPNTHNGADYEGEPAAQRLLGYAERLGALAARGRQQGRRIDVGDTRGYAWFRANHEAGCMPEPGQNGVFYLHPNATGAAALGRFWAEAIAAGLSRS